jgi:hypothetical protein
MKKLLILVAILYSQGAISQISNIDLNGAPLRVTPYSDIDGSPYLFADWAKADIGTTNAGLKEDVAYRFNIHDNELEVINESGNTIYLNKEYVEYVVLQRPSILIAQNNSQGLLPNLLFKKGFDYIKGVDQNDLLNVLAEGKKYTLVRKFYSDLVTPPKNSYAPTAGRMFVFEENYYLINSNFDVANVKSRTNVIVKALDSADQEKAKKIIKDKKLDLSRENHLVLFFTELNKA